MTQTALPVVILISGRGSNMQALLQARRRGLNIDVRAVISSRAQAPGLDIARVEGVPVQVLDHRHYSSREDYDRALAAHIDAHEPALVVLAGFMRILTPAFVEHYRGRMINIHPSLLPDFPGLNTHQRALQAGVDRHGASVHYVTAEVDGGPVIAQVVVNIEADDTAETLAARVLDQEHHLYVTVVDWISSGKVRWEDGKVLFDGHPLEAPVEI